MEDLQALAAFGATPTSVVHLDAAVGHHHIDYLDLPGLPPELPRITAVVEMAGRPVLYVARGPLTADQLTAICHLLAQRGAADHLGVLEPGKLTVVPLLRSKTERRKPLEVWNADSPSARTRLPGLAFGTSPNSAPATARHLHDELVELLANATTRIVRAGVTEPADALSLVGRALFLRFLLDRRIVNEKHLPELCPGARSLAEAMNTPERAIATSAWLDRTFNGNFLPLSHEDPNVFWSALPRHGEVCSELAKILVKSNAAGQLKFEWETLDFSHIPVGLLSQVYEIWCHKFTRAKAIQDSVWYTPRAIAEYVVDEAFYGLPNAAHARVLDPAVGAGVFLVAAYREIVGARWRQDGIRPDRTILRDILYRQLVGFDINEASLRLTALALYLTALELDPHPQPANRLKFKNLRSIGVLRDTRGELDDDDELPKVGSLGPHVGSEYVGAFDVVLGNPPWTAWTSLLKSSDPRLTPRRRTVEEVVRPIVASRLQGQLADHSSVDFEMVDLAPDLPFCWRALEWVRPGGVIAFALHTRLLFRQSDAGVRARAQLFKSVRVSGILNGAALSQTQVWPSHEAPFCLWFATNTPPNDTDVFNFVSPVIDNKLNSNGYLRIDAAAARPIPQAQIVARPWLLKTHYRGSALDVDVMSQVLEAAPTTLAEYWNHNNLSRSRGYIEAAERSRKKPAPHLHPLRDISFIQRPSARVNVRALPKFLARDVHQGRNPNVYRAPLVLALEAPKHDIGTTNSPRAVLAEQPVAFNHRYYGYSTAGHRDAEALARYVLVLLNSRLVLYVALMRSAMFGADRKRLNQSDLDDLPFRSLDELTPNQRRKVASVAEAILNSSTLPQKQIDAVTAELYGLSPWDAEVIEDTLSVGLPFRECVQRAQRRPNATERDAFKSRVEELLAPVLHHVGRETRIDPLPVADGESWLMLRVLAWPRGQMPVVQEVPHGLIDVVLTTARDGGASRIILRSDAPGQLVVAIFAQYRYWTLSQARQLALDLLGSREDESWLRGSAN